MATKTKKLNRSINGLQYKSNVASLNSARIQSIQAKLTIGRSNDQHEQEADRIADQVINASSSNIQRKCSGCEKEEEVQRKPLAAAITPRIQRQSQSTATTSTALESQLNASKSSGISLPENTRSFMESRIGADFSNVKIHTDSTAVQMSEQLGAKAFTHGNHVYFNQGKYNPSSSEGKHLLAHELVHTVQQGNGAVAKKEKNMVQLQSGGLPSSRDLYKRFKNSFESNISFHIKKQLAGKFGKALTSKEHAYQELQRLIEELKVAGRMIDRAGKLTLELRGLKLSINDSNGEGKSKMINFSVPPIRSIYFPVLEGQQGISPDDKRDFITKSFPPGTIAFSVTNEKLPPTFDKVFRMHQSFYINTNNGNFLEIPIITLYFQVVSLM